MAHRLRIEETTYEIHAPVNASSLGRLLGESGLDRRRLALSLAVRAALVTLATVVLWRRGDFDLSTTVDQVVAVIYAVIVLFPLIHCKDSMQFYQNGIVFNGKPCIFKTNKATWSSRSGTLYLLPNAELHLAGMPKGANVTYIKNAQKLFDQFYINPGIQIGCEL